MSRERFSPHTVQSLVLPHYDYCDTIYMCANKNTLNKLQLVQNIGCRTILLSDKRAHIDDMHKQLRLMPLDERRNIHLSLLCLENIYPENKQSLTKIFQPALIESLTNFFQPALFVWGWRTWGVGNKNMKVFNLKTEKGRCAFAFWGLRHWNRLGNELKTIEKFHIFHRKIMKRASIELDNHPT